MSNTKTGFLVYILCKQCNGNTKECMECKKLGYHLYIISDDPIKSGDKIYVDDINGHERSILTAASDILTYQEGIYTREYVKLAPNSHGWISARIQHDGVKKVILDSSQIPQSVFSTALSGQLRHGSQVQVVIDSSGNPLLSDNIANISFILSGNLNNSDVISKLINPFIDYDDWLWIKPDFKGQAYGRKDIEAIRDYLTELLATTK